MAVLLVQRERIAQNYKLFKKVNPKKTVISVLSDNAFGMGIEETAAIVANCGGNVFGVHTIEDAMKVKEKLPDSEVILFTPCDNQNASLAFKNNIIVTASSKDNAVLLDGVARKMGVRVRVNLLFDIGTGRFGFPVDDASSVASTVKYLENLDVVACGAFPVSSTTPSKIKKIYGLTEKKFSAAVTALKRSGFNPALIYATSTSEALALENYRWNATLLDTGLAGILKIKDKWGFREVGRVVANVDEIKWLKKGDTIGDNSSKKMSKPTKVAVINTGYGEGVFLARKKKKGIFARNRLTCELNGKKVDVIGEVGFTSITVDVTDVECSTGDIIYVDTLPTFINPNIRREYV